jgi:hypothetical protein
MTRNELNMKLAAVITTLDEVPFAPASNLYLLMDSNMEDYETAKMILQTGGLATFTASTATITEAGRAMAAKINAALLEARKAKMDGQSEPRF